MSVPPPPPSASPQSPTHDFTEVVMGNRYGTSLPLWCKDLVAGTVGGVAGIVAGQPMDTVKVRMQTAKSGAGGVRAGVVDVVGATFRHEGLRGFYKGLAAPCVSNAPINAVVFTAYGTVTRLLEEHDPAGERLSRASKEMLAGATGGLIQVSFSSPAELIKITQQVQRSVAQTSTLECAQSIVRANGIGGLMHGAGWTAMRDVPAFGMYFYSYERCKLQFSPGGGDPGTVAQLASGGIAGTLSWAITQPIDVVKSCVQMQLALPVHERRGTMQIIRDGLEKEGSRFFFRGYVPTLLRAFPVSAVTFFVYENVLRIL